VNVIFFFFFDMIFADGIERNFEARSSNILFRPQRVTWKLDGICGIIYVNHNLLRLDM
jgi:hypothetical protein